MAAAFCKAWVYHFPYPVFSLLMICMPVHVLGQIDRESPFPAVQALKTDERIELDGLLAEAVWQIAEPATGFRQREPKEGMPATEKTEVRIVFNEETLYIGVMAFDRQPEKIIARVLQRDKIMATNYAGQPGRPPRWYD